MKPTRKRNGLTDRRQEASLGVMSIVVTVTITITMSMCEDA